MRENGEIRKLEDDLFSNLSSYTSYFISFIGLLL